MLERAAGARAAEEARDLPTGRPPKMTAQQRAAVAAMLASGIRAEDVAAGFGIAKSTLYRALSRQREEAQAALLADDLRLRTGKHNEPRLFSRNFILRIVNGERRLRPVVIGVPRLRDRRGRMHLTGGHP
ncbi:helix-turn-helix domain-containing protein [Nonomuraea spiralis]|uniref:helix-turn-helix domain-containing protein n=1 Tax=Nonomuraea spiralis TaxID=46182 RepID=UPI0037898C30